jgi:quinol monooxygenase YgiN
MNMMPFVHRDVSRRQARQNGAVLVVIAHYRVVPGHADAVAEVLGRHAMASRAEAGCQDFVAHRAVDDPDRFALYEAYTDEAAFRAHRDTPHFVENIERVVAPLLAERSWARYEPLPDGRPAG